MEDKQNIFSAWKLKLFFFAKKHEKYILNVVFLQPNK